MCVMLCVLLCVCLVIVSRFDESLEAYRRAGRPDLSATLVHTLAHNAGN